MLNNIENHLVIGSPFNESRYNCEDEADRRERLSEGCKYKVDGLCHFNPNLYFEICGDLESCPEGRW